MTRKVRRRSAFFNFTNAPVTGCPDASLMTPCTEPRSSAAQTDWVETSTAPAASKTARFRRIVPWVIGRLLVVPAPPSLGRDGGEFSPSWSARRGHNPSSPGNEPDRDVEDHANSRHLIRRDPYRYGSMPLALMTGATAGDDR